jgi:hypothetical protein
VPSAAASAIPSGVNVTMTSRWAATRPSLSQPLKLVASLR